MVGIKSLLHKTKLSDFIDFMHSSGFMLLPKREFYHPAKTICFVDIRNNRGKVYIYDDNGKEHFSVPDGLSSQMVLEYVEQVRAVRENNKNFTCTKCKLHKFSNRYVLGDKIPPVDMLFLDETPTLSANSFGSERHTLGYKVIGRMLSTISNNLTFELLSMTFCTARDGANSDVREPKAEEVLACLSNVMDKVNDLKPKFIVYLSKNVRHYYGRKLDMPSTLIVNPQIIANQGGPMSKWWLPTVRKLRDLIDS